jgi:glycosyltransferase involved in cell wall biosynthesis
MLQEVLDSLARQTFPFDLFEVIVVDDGGQDGTHEIASQIYPFRLRYIRQINQGDAVARNTGANESRAEILVSLDDDMILEQDYLKCLIAEVDRDHRKLVAGSWYLWLEDVNPLKDAARFEKITLREGPFEIPFVEINTHSLAIRRDHFLFLGMMQDLGFPGSSMWTDVDLAYRAYLKGFQFVRVGGAIIWHRDYVYRSLENRKKRMHEVAYRAVFLFRRSPDLIRFLPMFEDKRPVDWRLDSPGVILRKLVRQLNSTIAVLWFLAILRNISGRMPFPSKISNSLERWLIGGTIARGFYRGLKDFADR